MDGGEAVVTSFFLFEQHHATFYSGHENERGVIGTIKSDKMFINPTGIFKHVVPVIKRMVNTYYSQFLCLQFKFKAPL